MPSSNKKIFFIAFLIAIIAIIGFVMYVGTSTKTQGDLTNASGTPMLIEEDPGETPVDAFAYVNVFFTTLNAFDSASSSGAIGCGDGLVAYKIPVDEVNAASRGDLSSFLLQKIQDPAFFAEAQLAYDAYFKSKKGSPITIVSGDPKEKKELSNVLKSSKLSIQSVKDVPGNYEIKMKGQAILGGACDEPRLKAQLVNLMKSAMLSEDVKVFINNKSL